VVTILPFTFRGSPEFSYLGDGIVDLLGTKLDGAGDLSTSDPHAVLSLVERQGARGTDPAAAREIAGRFGASYFITGEMLEAGGNIHLSASLYEPERPQPVATHSVEGPAESLFGLVDEIASALLAEQIQAPSVKVFSTAAMTTESLPALKAYLRAESELRGGEFTRALESYQQTVELDPEFALAWYRLSVAAEWSTRNDLVEPAVAKALEFGDRLSVHDRDLLEARLANRSGDPEGAEQIYRSILGRHPDDVEAWVQMSEILSHYGYMTGRSMTESREALERVIHYEPGYVGAWWHLARVAAVEDKPEEVDRIVRRIVEMNPEGERSLEMEILRAVMLGDEEGFRSLVGKLEAVEDHVVMLSGWTLAMTRSDPSHAIAVLEVLTHPRRSDYARAAGHQNVAWLELCRGRLEAALEQIERAGRIHPTARLEAEPLMLLLPWVPENRERLVVLRDDLAAWDAAAVAPSPNPTNFFSTHDAIHSLLRVYQIELIDRRLGEGSAGTRAESHALADLASTMPDGIPRRLAEYLQDSLRAERLLAEGADAEALASLESARFGWAYQDAYSSPFYAASFDRWTRAELLRRAGRADEALQWYSTFGEIGVADEAFVVPATLRRAQILDQRGETGEALRLYRQVVALWSDADPELRGWIGEAEGRIAILEDELSG
jgi:tetratricopeptide (TPR) repeat protein